MLRRSQPRGTRSRVAEQFSSILGKIPEKLQESLAKCLCYPLGGNVCFGATFYNDVLTLPGDMFGVPYRRQFLTRAESRSILAAAKKYSG